jgi:cell division protein FtsQ
LVGAREAYEYATTSARFEVSALIYQPTPHVDDARLRELLALAPGTNILSVETTELAARIAAEPWVEHATVVRHLPDTLEVEVVEREPAALLLAGRFYLVDRNGIPFKRVEARERGDLPILSGIDRAQLASHRDAAIERIRGALAVLKSYEDKQRPRLGEVHLDDDGSVTLYTEEAGTQFRLGRVSPEAALPRLDAVRAALGAKADRLAVLHLDAETVPGANPRVVARFFSPEDEAALIAEAAPRTASGTPSAKHSDPTPTAVKKRRIPRYE